ncbi:MAG: hypothetical protein J6S85_07450 [Methanobrevibacter sp.]|nr:hypothetical protein [Methanobrevibacter sp.]
MLALKIIATVLLGLSCITTFIKNVNIFEDSNEKSFNTKAIALFTLWGWLWRALVIVALWVR